MKDRDDGAPGEGFLGRWAQRKSAVRRGLQPPPEAPAPIGTTPDVAAPPQSATPAPAPVDSTDVPPEKPPLPPLETLTPDSDYSGFMSPEVDEALRRAALRKLFHSPAMNVTDGLDDYAEDYTSFVPLGNMITADMKHQVEVEAERARRRAEAEQAAADERRALEAGETAPDDETPSRLAAQDEAGEPVPAPEQVAEDGAAETPAATSDRASAGADTGADAPPAGRPAQAGDTPAAGTADTDPQRPRDATRTAARARPGDEHGG